MYTCLQLPLIELQLTFFQELGHVFQDYTILSSKILRDNMGNSRGVGFARYATPPFGDESR